MITDSIHLNDSHYMPGPDFGLWQVDNTLAACAE